MVFTNHTALAMVIMEIPEWMGMAGFNGTNKKSKSWSKEDSCKVWLWSILGGGIGLMSVLGLTFVISHHFELPAEAYEAPFDVTLLPTWTIFSFFVSIAITAGVVEEAAFRIYAFTTSEEIWLAMGHSYNCYSFLRGSFKSCVARIFFLPFFLAYSILHGYLVYVTRSILPSVFLHALGDLTILPHAVWSPWKYWRITFYT